MQATALATPPEVVRRLSDAVGAAAMDEATRSRTANAGGEISFMDTETFGKFVDEDSARWRKSWGRSDRDRARRAAQATACGP